MNKIDFQKVKGHAQNLTTRKQQNQNMDLHFCYKILSFLHDFCTRIHPMQMTTVIPIGVSWELQDKCHAKILLHFILNLSSPAPFK